MALSWEAIKDPDEIKDYSIDWSALLAEDSDTIATSNWALVDGSGVNIDSNSAADTTTTIWLSGGTAGVNCQFRNRITTNGGRTYDQTCKLRVKTK